MTINIYGRVNVANIQEIMTRVGVDERAIVLTISNDCFLETGAICLLTNWLLLQKASGRTISVTGTGQAIPYLARMDFFRVLEVSEPDHGRRPEGGRCIPILSVENEEAVFSAVNRIADMVLQQFDDAAEFLPAFEWAINEIIDNIFIHSETKTPGVVCAQLFPNEKHLDIAICDNGIGIRASLSKSREAVAKLLTRLTSHRRSIVLSEAAFGRDRQVVGDDNHVW